MSFFSFFVEIAMYHSKKKMCRFIDKEQNSLFKKKEKKGQERQFNMKECSLLFERPGFSSRHPRQVAPNTL